MFIIKYNIEKINHTCIVFKNVIGDHSIGCKKLFEGSYFRCWKFCKENNINLKEVIKK